MKSQQKRVAEPQESLAAKEAENAAKRHNLKALQQVRTAMVTPTTCRLNSTCVRLTSQHTYRFACCRCKAV